MGSADLIQIVNENDQPIRGATREEAHEKGLWHRLVRIFVEDGQGNVLLQLRSPNKTASPNKWDFSASGHVDFAEKYEVAARRELKEETGIDLVDVHEIGAYKRQRIDGARKLNRFNNIYRVVVDPSILLKPQVSEVAELRWFTILEVKKLVVEQPDNATEGLKYAVTHIY